MLLRRLFHYQNAIRCGGQLAHCTPRIAVMTPVTPKFPMFIPRGHVLLKLKATTLHEIGSLQRYAGSRFEWTADIAVKRLIRALGTAFLFSGELILWGANFIYPSPEWSEGHGYEKLEERYCVHNVCMWERGRIPVVCVCACVYVIYLFPGACTTCLKFSGVGVDILGSA